MASKLLLVCISVSLLQGLVLAQPPEHEMGVSKDQVYKTNEVIVKSKGYPLPTKESPQICSVRYIKAAGELIDLLRITMEVQVLKSSDRPEYDVVQSRSARYNVHCGFKLLVQNHLPQYFQILDFCPPAYQHTHMLTGNGNMRQNDPYIDIMFSRTNSEVVGSVKLRLQANLRQEGRSIYEAGNGSLNLTCFPKSDAKTTTTTIPPTPVTLIPLGQVHEISTTEKIKYYTHSLIIQTNKYPKMLDFDDQCCRVQFNSLNNYEKANIRVSIEVMDIQATKTPCQYKLGIINRLGTHYEGQKDYCPDELTDVIQLAPKGRTRYEPNFYMRFHVNGFGGEGRMRLNFKLMMEKNHKLENATTTLNVFCWPKAPETKRTIPPTPLPLPPLPYIGRDMPHQSWDFGDGNIAGAPRAMRQTSDGDKNADDDKTDKAKLVKKLIKDNIIYFGAGAAGLFLVIMIVVVVCIKKSKSKDCDSEQGKST